MVLSRNYLATCSVAALMAATLFGFIFPVQAQDTRLSLADRVSRLEQQAQANQANASTVNQISELQQQNAQLQGKIEELQHQLQTMQDSGKSQYVDLDTRLGRLEGNRAGTAPGAGPAAASAATSPTPASADSTTDDMMAPPPQPASVTPVGGRGAAPAAATKAPTPQAVDPAQQAAYNAAFTALRGGDFASSAKGFKDFLTKYPDSPLAPNAYYWLGESYYGATNYSVALEAFKRLVGHWPTSEKAPDALLKMGYCQQLLKQQNEAVATLKSVSVKYPGSKAASLAAERLRRMQQPAN
ncbi:tol-pal system protein YbgF [Pinirhizobacter sp.]|uniref:tol-pal system protein YbgF n=1 Tax=Pinirhizobacter sp. TaxID=2950432 RepID=UPI002D1FB792|nr:tol-pal system protein YbgF [Pinirhizobacter sp.]